MACDVSLLTHTSISLLVLKLESMISDLLARQLQVLHLLHLHLLLHLLLHLQLLHLHLLHLLLLHRLQLKVVNKDT